MKTNSQEIVLGAGENLEITATGISCKVAGPCTLYFNWNLETEPKLRLEQIETLVTHSLAKLPKK